MGLDAVIDVAEAGLLHGQRGPVVDRCAKEVFYLSAEEALDGAVGLWRANAGADAAQQRVIAGERGLVGLATEA